MSAQPWSQFATTVGNYFKQALYVAAMAAMIQNGVVLYSAAFRPGSGAEWVVSAQPWSQFATTVKQLLQARPLRDRHRGGRELERAALYGGVSPRSGRCGMGCRQLHVEGFAKQTDTYFAQGLYATGITACRLAV